MNTLWANNNSSWTTVCSIVFGICCCFYYWSIRTYDFWRKRNVPYVKPVPLFGNMFRFLIRKDNYAEIVTKMYNSLDGQSYGGYFEMREPILLVRDPKLVAAITVKDFDHFRDREFDFIFNPNAKQLNPLSSNLFTLKDDRWKVLRKKLTPGFTANKLRSMSVELERCTDILLADLLQRRRNDVDDGLDVRELLIGYTIDVIGNCAFGLDFTSLNRQRKAEVIRMSKNASGDSNSYALRFTLLNIHPMLSKLFPIPDMPKDVTGFFFSLISDAIGGRRKSAVSSSDSRRNDFLQTLIDSTTDADGYDEIDLVSNVFVFFSGGFDSSASTMMYCLYELAYNTDVQEKFRTEVENLRLKNGNLTVEATNQLKYADMIIAEALRMYSPESVLYRVCTKDYRIPGMDGVIPVGTKLIIPSFAIQNDPKIFPDPKKFDPERFSSENKSDIPNGSYLPFGEGPRQCIGMRFAKMVMKFALAKIVNNFSIEPCSKTERPLQLVKGTPLYIPKNGMWLNLKQI